MKTPQEEAEEWVKRIDNNHLYSDWRYDREELRSLIESILSESGRAELIAVARAAKEYAGTISECCMTGDCTGEVCELHCALQALRTTGKVEL